ncbi:MAG: c-type cytochrome [Proteobacteria bacterium]|jgi:cytochrome c5|nr:c-type cytochrome [Pseudomonadota bacterium]MDA0942021.1 c-type cytochrome [Pseudomonadota bacterium]MDA1034107.1 c-type cytochrome [Pseudomonadota bacterium]
MSKNSNLRSVIETTAVVIGSFVAAIVLIVLLTKDYSSGAAQAPAKLVDAPTTQPVAQVAVADETTSDETASGSIDAKKIIAANCAMCHEGGLMGSPKIRNAEQWAPRIAQGKDTLVLNAINGIRQMPARGGNAKLSDEEVAAAVIDMANASGANF